MYLVLSDAVVISGNYSVVYKKNGGSFQRSENYTGHLWI